MAGEIVAVAVGVVALLGAGYRVTRWVLSVNHRARRRDETLERVAQWFPVEKPNGEVSLPAQVKRLHECLDRTRQDVRLLKLDVDQLKQKRV